jgi:hypothetical protein
MLPGGKAAVTCSGGVMSGAVAPALARAGRAGGAHSRGAVAGRGHCDRQVPQAAHTRCAPAMTRCRPPGKPPAAADAGLRREAVSLATGAAVRPPHPSGGP